MASDKSRGLLGKADLDLSQFAYDDYKVLRLNINECEYPDSWIEVGLKATLAAKSTRNDLSFSARSTSGVNVGESDQ